MNDDCENPGIHDSVRLQRDKLEQAMRKILLDLGSQGANWNKNHSGRMAWMIARVALDELEHPN